MRNRIAWLCPPCHKQIHACISEGEMERVYHSIETLRTHPEVAAFLAWISPRPGDTVVPVYRRRQG
jgi:hypothetical protein